MITGNLKDELWREYEWDTGNGAMRTVRINNPITLYMRDGGTTHRVLDTDGIIHCVPAVGFMGCELRWKPSNVNNPVAF